MKLRLRGNSLRLRLGKREVAALAEGGVIEESVQIGPQPGGQLVYCLKLSDNVDSPTAQFLKNQIVVHVPLETGKFWAEGSEIGIYSETEWGLRLSIEKDFKCLEVRPNENEEDAFENPKAGTGVGCGTHEED